MIIFVFNAYHGFLAAISNNTINDNITVTTIDKTINSIYNRRIK